MSRVTITKEQIGGTLALPNTKEILIPDAQALDQIPVPSVESWRNIFKQVSGSIRVLVGEHVYIAQNIATGGSSENGTPYLTPESKDPKKLVEATFYHECAASGKAHFHTDAWELREEVDPKMVLPLVRFLIANRIGTHKSRRGIDQKNGYKWIGTDPITYQLEKAIAFFSDSQKQ